MKDRWMNRSIAVDPKLQSKVDYFISPYNKTLHCNKSMEFEDQHKMIQEAQSSEDPSNKKWKKMMEFIVNQEQKVFRHSLNSINNRLYIELNKMLKISDKKKKTEEEAQIKEIEEIDCEVKTNRRASVVVTNHPKQNSEGKSSDSSKNSLQQFAESFKKTKRSSVRHKFKPQMTLQNLEAGNEIANNFIESAEPTEILNIMSELRKGSIQREKKKIKLSSNLTFLSTVKKLRRRRDRRDIEISIPCKPEGLRSKISEFSPVSLSGKYSGKLIGKWISSHPKYLAKVGYFSHFSL